MKKKNKLVYGWGINDADYNVYSYVKINGVSRIESVCPVYVDWKDMLRRAFSEKYQKLFPTYKGTIVCEDWKYFSNFRKWVLDVQPNKDWANCCLDKDLLLEGNKVYSPNTCIYVDNSLNSFILKSCGGIDKIKGFNIDKKTGKFRASCGNPFGKTATEKVGYLGLFNCEASATDAWRKQKHIYACMWADLQSDTRLAETLRQRFAPDRYVNNL